MNIEDKVSVELTQEDVTKILAKHFQEQGIDINQVTFSVGGHNVEGDFMAELPLDYRLDTIYCSGTRR